MTKKEKWAHIEKCLTEMGEQTDNVKKVCESIGMSYESVLVNYGDSCLDMLVDSLGMLCGDWDSMVWFVYENDYGRYGLVAGKDDKKKKIDSIKKLKWLCEL